MLCQECSRRESCKFLCKKAEKYARRDHVAQRERTVSIIRANTNANLNLPEDNHAQIYPYSWKQLASYFSEDSLNFLFLTKLQNKILKMFYFDGLSYGEIARALSGGWNNRGINQDSVSWQLRYAKRRIIQISSKSEGRNKCPNANTG